MWAEASKARTAFAATLALGALLLAIPAARWLLADSALPESPDRALRWVPLHPRALELAATGAFEAGDDSRALDLARQAIALRPLEGRPYRILAAIHERAGRMADARAAHLAAIAVSPSDAMARLWIGSQWLAESRFPDALAHIDRALRARPDLSSTVFPVLAAGLETPPFVEALVAVLVDRPPWRRDFLTHLSGNPADLDDVVALFEALAGPSPLAMDEQRLLVDALERGARWNELEEIWRRLVDPGANGRSTPVDGGFERDPHGFGLGWRMAKVPGALIGFAPARGSIDGGRAMAIRFLDQRVPFEHVRQRLLLPEGGHRLSGEARVDGLRARRGLRWEVTCEGRTDPLAVSPLFVGSHGWQPWSIDFSVPSGCPTQWLVLRIAAIGPSEQLIGGAVAFDGLRIEQRHESRPESIAE